MTNCDNIGIYDFTCLLQNQTFTTGISFTKGVDKIPWDLTELKNIKMGIFDPFNKNTKTLEIGDGIEIVGVDNDGINIVLPQSFTLVLTQFTYTYELMFIYPNDENEYILKGNLILDRTKTR
jgi:hypothetical protein